MQSFDIPVPPGHRGITAYVNLIDGQTEEVRQTFRDNLFKASCQDIQKAVNQHIAPGFKESVLVTFAGAELIEQENKKLQTPLNIE